MSRQPRQPRISRTSQSRDIDRRSSSRRSALSSGLANRSSRPIRRTSNRVRPILVRPPRFYNDRRTWDGSRPSFYPETFDNVQRGEPLICVSCNIPLQRGGNRRNTASLDHITPWLDYIRRNIDPEYVTVDGSRFELYFADDAQRFYNVVDNLRIVCRPCNSGRGNPRRGLDDTDNPNRYLGPAEDQEEMRDEE